MTDKELHDILERCGNTTFISGKPETTVTREEADGNIEFIIHAKEDIFGLLEKTCFSEQRSNEKTRLLTPIR